MNSFRTALEQGDGLNLSGPVMPDKKPSGANETQGLGSVEVPRETVRSANHRDDDRHRLASERATLTVGRKKHQVELINLSGGGAMVRTDARLVMWQKVHLGLGDCAPVECAVRWIRGDRIGLEFAPETQVGGDTDIRNAMLLEVLKRSFPESAVAPVAAAPVPAPVRPDEPADAPSAGQRRSAIRHPLIWRGEIHCNHDTTPVRLRNISEQGALVDSDVAFASDAEALLDLGAAGQHFVTITWSRGDQVGLRFASPFNIALLSKAKPEVATQQWIRPAYLNSSRGSEVHAANGWHSSSLTELREELEGFLRH